MAASPDQPEAPGRAVPLAAVLLPVVGCAALLLAALAAPAVVLVAVVLLQVPLALGWLALTGATGTGGGIVLVLAAAASADVAVLAAPGDGARALGPVVGLALGGAFLHQLLRGRHRVGVTDSLAAVLSAAVLAVSAACWVAVRGEADGREIVVTAATALGVMLLAGRVLTTVLGAAGAPGGRRLTAAAAGAAAGVAAGALVGGAYADVGTGYGAVMAVAVAVAALTADLAVDVVAAGLPGTAVRAQGAVLPVAALLPLAAAAPAAYLVGRVLLG